MNRLNISLLALLAIFAFSTPAFAGHFEDEGFCEEFPNHPHCDGDGEGEGGSGGSFSGTNQQGQAQGIFGSGNSYSGSEGGNAEQGQQQGQIGINDLDFDADLTNRNALDFNADLTNRNSNDVDTRTRTNTRTNTDTETNTETSTETNQGQQQGQIGINKQGQQQEGYNAQGQFGYIDSHDETYYEAQERNPVSSAAPVSASACSSGVSAQGVDLGAALAVTNPYCNLALTAEVARAQNMPRTAEEMVILMRRMARADAEGLFGIRGFMRGVPIAGGMLGWVW